jgi:uncharacterized protein YxjI
VTVWGRREESREERQTFGGGDAVHYRMRQQLVSFGDDYWIETDRGERVYKVDGQALRIRKTLVFEDAHGQALCTIRERMLRIKETMDIEGPNGEHVATVKKALFTPLRERFTVDIAAGPALDVQGNFLDHEYTIEEGRTKVAEVSKRWFRLRDAYGVEIAPGQNDVLILAITVCVDMMAHGRR